MTSLPEASSLSSADGIVALTGGEDRIYEAVRLLAEGKAKRLLISGVNPGTNKPILMALNAADKSDAHLFYCCIDLDKRALNTESNAIETTAWVRKQGFRSLIVVTSNYHMPRTLIELRQAMPDVVLTPYPVDSPTLDAEWWRDERSLWVLTKEYVKFATALFRYAAHRVVNAPEKDARHTRTLDASLG